MSDIRDLTLQERVITHCKSIYFARQILTVTFGEIIGTDEVIFWGIQIDFVLRFERHIDVATPWVLNVRY